MSGDHDGGHNPEPEPYAALRTKALESLLVEKGLISTDAIDALVSAYEQDIGPLNGARVVAGAWLDPAYKRRLLENGTAAIAELGFEGLEGSQIVVLENTSTVHNVVVCTLCSYATHGRYLVFRRPGTSRRHTGRALSWSHGQSYESSGWSSMSQWRSESGTATPTCDIWSCRSVPVARSASERQSW